jgi:type I restriction enzyme S subunit
MAQPKLNKTKLNSIPLPIPPLPEQQRIVAILDKAFAAIATAKTNAQQNLLNAKELFENSLQLLFENKGDDWVQTSLKTEIDLATGFAFKSKHYTNNDGDILLLRGDNIMQGDFRWKDAKRWDKSEYKDFEKYQLQENDIVLAMDRPWVKAGLKCARVSKSELPSLLVQRTARLRNKPQLDNSFLYYLIQSAGFTDYLIDIQTGIGVPHISGNQIFGFTFRKPDLKEQQQIVKKLNSLSAETKKLEGIYKQKINDLEELKKSVLSKAFKGEL